MSLTVRLTPFEEAQLLAQAAARGVSPEDLIREAIEPILKRTSSVSEEPAKPRRRISQAIAERMKAVPEEVFDRLPKDGASEHDHYIYESPKRNG